MVSKWNAAKKKTYHNVRDSNNRFNKSSISNHFFHCANAIQRHSGSSGLLWKRGLDDHYAQSCSFFCLCAAIFYVLGHNYISRK